jgi:arylsulfatase A-like enzyme
VVDPIETKPVEGGNVLLVVIDTLNAKHLGAYGYERDTSPTIDALARDGLLLTNYVSNCPWTRPSMATIMTGLPKAEHHMELNCPPLADEITTLAERFREAGYRTGGFVGNPLVRAKWGFGQGFETYVDAAELDTYSMADDSVIAKRAVRWIKQVADEPFFALVFFTSPHIPYRVARKHPPFFKRLPEGYVIERPKREYPEGMEPGVRAWTMAAYDSEILYTDSQLARLLKQLERSKIRDKTAIVITADHGEMFGPHGCFTHTYHMWEPVLRVPFIVSAPGMSASGVYDDRPFTHVDVAPTLLDLAGIDPPGPELDGESIVETLTRPGAGRDRQLFGQYNAHGIRRETTRKGRWKLVHHHQVEESALQSLTMFQGDPNDPPDTEDLPSLAWQGERYELYDLATDPEENVNRFEQRKGEAETAELMAAILDFLQSNGETSVEIDDDLKQALEALGYLGTPADGP